MISYGGRVESNWGCISKYKCQGTGTWKNDYGTIKQYFCSEEQKSDYADHFNQGWEWGTLIDE